MAADVEGAPCVHVRLALADLSLEFRGSPTFVERVIDPRLQSTRPRSADPETTQDAGDRAAEETEDATEAPLASLPERAPDLGFQPTSSHFSQFVQQIGPRASTPDQQAMAFAFFLWNYERMETFAPDELEGCFRAVGLDAPTDLGDRLVTLRDQKRFVGGPDEAERYELTTKGRNYVKNRLLSTV
jgi:hypothetical protein